MYAETRTRVACYMCKSNNKWIQVAWQREIVKENNTIIDEAVKAMMEIEKTLAFVENNVRLEVLELGWKPTWKKVMAELKKGVEKKRMETYEQEGLQSDLYIRQEQECHLWLRQRLTPRKTASIMTVIEQMVETRGWKLARGLIENGRCRLCREFSQTVEHLVAGCKMIASSGYIARHNRALIVMAITCSEEYGLAGKETKWYKEN